MQAVNRKLTKTIETVLWAVAFFVYYSFYFALIKIFTWLDSSLNLITVTAMLLPFFFLLILLIYKRQRYRLESNEALPVSGTVLQHTGKIVTLLLITALIPVMVGFSKLGINEYYSSFSQQKWLDAPDKRQLMISDLVINHGLRGMEREKVQKLLGSATEGRFGGQPNQLVYYIGEGYIDSNWLVLRFDENNKVKECRIQSD